MAPACARGPPPHDIASLKRRSAQQVVKLAIRDAVVQAVEVLVDLGPPPPQSLALRTLDLAGAHQALWLTASRSAVARELTGRRVCGSGRGWQPSPAEDSSCWIRPARENGSMLK